MSETSFTEAFNRAREAEIQADHNLSLERQRLRALQKTKCGACSEKFCLCGKDIAVRNDQPAHQHLGSDVL